jgi:hypothetical protein
MEQLCLLTKLLVICILILVFYKLYKQSQNNILAEGFENINYLKLNETHLESEGTKLDLLYANYSGEEIGKDVWENKTLDQCTDLCNQLDKCIGFSRELVNDDAPAKCFPRTKIFNCHSNRKGDVLQMQNAIKYNSYVKSNISKTNNVLTKCIGDTNLTLNRSVYIKSQLYPKKYIGSVGDGLVMLVDMNEPDFQKKCNFRIEIGKDGIGTVSFLHIDSNTYLYRSTVPITTAMQMRPQLPQQMMIKDTLILKDITSNKTVDRQRVSFNILDAMKNLMKFKCLALDGETTNKYICINPDNKNYLACMEMMPTNNESTYVFNIIDNIIKSTIISSVNNLPLNNLTNYPTASTTTVPAMTISMTTMPATTMPLTTSPMYNTNNNNTMNENNQKELFQQTDAIGNIIQNNADKNKVNLDTVNNIALYKNIFDTPDNVKINNYINDNYGVNNNTGNNTYFSVSKKMNDIVLNNQLSKSINKKQEEYDAIKQLNLEIEREIANLNMGLNAKNDKIYNNIDKMRITDMADDYFTLKNISKLQYN